MVSTGMPLCCTVAHRCSSFSSFRVAGDSFSKRPIGGFDISIEPLFAARPTFILGHAQIFFDFIEGFTLPNHLADSLKEEVIELVGFIQKFVLDNLQIIYYCEKGAGVCAISFGGDQK